MNIKTVTEEYGVRQLTVMYDDMEFTYDVVTWELDEHNNLAFREVVVGPKGKCSAEIAVVRKWREYRIGSDVSIVPVTVQLVEQEDDQ